MGQQDVTPNNDSDDTLAYEDMTSPSGGQSNVPARSERVIRSLSRPTTDAQAVAAANVARGQIDRIYERDSPYKEFDSPAQNTQAAQSPYERTHAPESSLGTTDHLTKYHTAWQDYYQKYYESYYTQAVKQTAEQLRLRAEMEAKAKPGAVFGHTAASQPQTAASPVGDDTPTAAMRKLQSQFKEKIGSRAAKVRKSHHFWPLVTAASVAALFIFLQYNRLLVANVAAYVSPGNVDPQNIIVDPTTDTKVSADPKLIIPKINVDAPVIYTVTKYDNDEIEANLKNGVVKYPIPGANAFPGQVGNLVIGGHSSNDVFDDGQYKFVFVQLEKLAIGDTMYLNYNGTRYTYHITKTQTIEPNEISVITAPVTKPTITLITCTPVGTALHRFLVFGEQVSPDPSGATAADNASTGSDSTTIPGNSPTLLQRIFGN